MFLEKLRQLTITQTLVAGFFGLLCLGGFLLMLPISSAEGEVTPFWDAFFTATSALCVTGQITLNTALHWSWFGKLVIISLIQVGGLGFMSFILTFFFMTGRRINLRQQKIVQESLNLGDISESKSLIRYVVQFSLITELIGAILLAFNFVPHFGWRQGLIYSVFHSISAFCNAGFDLFGNSLYDFKNSPYVLIIISLLIIFGGLGFIVWRDLMTYHKNKHLLLHTRLVVITTGIILFGSLILFTISEGLNETYQDMPIAQQMVNNWFLAVTPRTAGFSNIDYNTLSMGGRLLTYLLMFIGGSSGSTAGGIKITTIAVLWIYFVSVIRNHEPVFQKRSISSLRVRQAFFLLVVSLLIIISATLTLAITQPFPEGYGLDALLMEVFSCFGTVGLSMGLTSHFNSLGKLILMILMFVGRVGAVTVIWSFKRIDKESHIHYPEGNILVG